VFDHPPGFSKKTMSLLGSIDTAMTSRNSNQGKPTLERVGHAVFDDGGLFDVLREYSGFDDEISGEGNTSVQGSDQQKTSGTPKGAAKGFMGLDFATTQGKLIIGAIVLAVGFALWKFTRK
jgi:hypothetical protein